MSAIDELQCDILVLGGGRAAAGAAWAAAQAGAGVRTLAGAEAPWGVFGPHEVAAVVGGVAAVLRPRRLILAPNPYSVPLAVPGWALPGVAMLDAPPPPGRLVLAGAAPGVVRAALGLLRGGRLLAGVVLAGGVAQPGAVAALRRAGVRVLRGDVLRCLGTAAFRGLLVRTVAGDRVVAAEGCILHGGWAPETAYARALEVPHRVLVPGVLAPLADAAGRTAVPRVFVVPGGSRAAGVTVGYAAAASLGRPTPRRRPARGLPAWTPAAAAPWMDADVACPCEGVTAGTIRAALRDGAASLPAVKRATRAGMGRCQGRLCGTTLHALCGGGTTEAGHVAPRAPVRPVAAGLLMREVAMTGQPIAAPHPNRWLRPAPGPVVERADVAVVGGGVVGLSAALYLARAGVDVLVLDRGEPGLAASTANAGSLHVQLLPYDFDGTDPGPLGEALALGPASIALWRELAVEAGETLGIRTEGGLVLAADAADLAWLGRKAAFERDRGVDTRIIDGAELAAIAPALARRYAGASFCAAEGQIDPLRGTMALLRLVRAAGVRVCPGTAVEGLEPDGGSWRVRTAGGEVRAHQVLNAAGAYAGMVGRLAGVALPVRAVVQQVIATAAAPPMLRQLVAQARLHLSLKQGDAGHVLVGGGWPGRLDPDGATRLLRQSIEGNLWTAAQVMPGLVALDVVRAWTGLTVHLDRGPVLSATPGRPGLFHAVTANGYTLGPVAGRLAADAMLGRGAPPAAFVLG